MKRILLVLLVVVTVFVIFKGIKQRVAKDLAQPVVAPQLTATPVPSLVPNTKQTGEVTKSLFVPYWAVTGDKIEDTEYSQYIYFGLVPTNDGINTQDVGATHLEDFLSAVPDGAQKLLALRMIDSNQNTTILQSQKTQQAVITGAIEQAQEHGFDGLVLDLEISAIPFDSLIRQITTFVSSFYTAAKQRNLPFQLTIYGDTFYRLRPFDVKALAQKNDGMMIMAYDLHKANGNPGPNFPLHGQETYGYDMSKMVDDFVRYVPVKKLTVIFGLFGYDWTVDDKGVSLGQAKPVTYLEAKQKFLDSCSYEKCVVKRDSVSSETKVTYMQDEKAHVVWFEDPQSVAAKQAYLRGRGINHFSFWAYSYF